MKVQVHWWRVLLWCVSMVVTALALAALQLPSDWRFIVGFMAGVLLTLAFQAFYPLSEWERRP